MAPIYPLGSWNNNKVPWLKNKLNDKSNKSPLIQLHFAPHYSNQQPTPAGLPNLQRPGSLSPFLLTVLYRC